LLVNFSILLHAKFSVISCIRSYIALRLRLMLADSGVERYVALEELTAHKMGEAGGACEKGGSREVMINGQLSSLCNAV
jgi:hypothetical protein